MSYLDSDWVMIETEVEQIKRNECLRKSTRPYLEDWLDSMVSKKYEVQNHPRTFSNETYDGFYSSDAFGQSI